MLLGAPAITVYTRTLDASTMAPLSGYKIIIPFNTVPSGSTYLMADTEAAANSFLNYGILPSTEGGSSKYIIEFDIWNNEPALSGGYALAQYSDAVNLCLSVWDNQEMDSYANLAPQTSPNVVGKPVFYARCITNNLNTDFVPVIGDNGFTNIYGNVNPTNVGVLEGSAPGGDHAVIQTKIITPPNVPAKSYQFVFSLSYDWLPTEGGVYL